MRTISIRSWEISIGIDDFVGGNVDFGKAVENLKRDQNYYCFYHIVLNTEYHYDKRKFKYLIWSFQVIPTEDKLHFRNSPFKPKGVGNI
jgi:hypothetical protein